MSDIEEYRKRKAREAAAERKAARIAIGMEDPDGTIVVQEEDWSLIVGLYGPDPKGFRLETELDRKRQEKREAEHPEAIGKLAAAIVKQRKYR